MPHQSPLNQNLFKGLQPRHCQNESESHTTLTIYSSLLQHTYRSLASSPIMPPATTFPSILSRSILSHPHPSPAFPLIPLSFDRLKRCFSSHPLLTFPQHPLSSSAALILLPASSHIPRLSDLSQHLLQPQPIPSLSTFSFHATLIFSQRSLSSQAIASHPQHST